MLLLVASYLLGKNQSFDYLGLVTQDTWFRLPCNLLNLSPGPSKFMQNLL